MIKSKFVFWTFSLLFFVLLSGCIGGDAEYTSNISIINESGKNLSLILYDKDKTQVELIEKNSSFKNQIDSYSHYAGPLASMIDSLIIRFEDNRQVKYTYKEPEKKQNILWLDAYEVQNLSDYVRNYTYRITEQHYLLAK